MYIVALNSTGMKAAIMIAGVRKSDTCGHHVVSVKVAGKDRLFVEGITPLNSPIRVAIHKCRLAIEGTSTRYMRIGWTCECGGPSREF